MAPRDQVKATLKKLTNSYRETTKEFTKLKVPAAVIWFNHETNRLEVDGHGPIVQFLLQILDEIMQRPHFNIFTDEEIQRSQEYAPPTKPLNDMTTKELKQYAIGLMIHLLRKNTSLAIQKINLIGGQQMNLGKIFKVEELVGTEKLYVPIS